MIEINKLQIYKFQKNKKKNYRNIEIKIQKYPNTTYRNTEIQMTKIQKYELQNYGNTNYRNTNNNSSERRKKKSYLKFKEVP